MSTKEMEHMLSNPVFYILMRNDLESMNPGKGMAQASHAYAALRKAIKSKPNIQRDFINWMNTTEQDFGTTIVLGGRHSFIDGAVKKAQKDILMCAGWVHDPTYPVKDGDVLHLIPLNTCAFIFGEQSEVREVTQYLKLQP